MSYSDWMLSENEEAGEEEELRRQKAAPIMEGEDWERFERLQDERAEEEYHERRQHKKDEEAEARVS